MIEAALRREVGRPRVFSDDVIFAAVAFIIRQDGYPALTLEAVAERVGCTRQALLRRYGSRRGMLLASLEATAARISANFNQTSQMESSPLEALKTRFLLPPNSRPEMGLDPVPVANTLAYILMTSPDPDFSQQFTSLVAIAQTELQGLLDTAVAKGELRPVNTRRLARVLHAVWTGETLNWCADQSVPYSTTQAAIFEQIIAPYRL